MPIGQGAIGRPSSLIGPGLKGPYGRSHFRSRPFGTTTLYIAGVTKDSTGTPLGGCTVQLFRTWNGELVRQTISDGSGNYTLTAPGTGPFYVMAYKAGSPDVAGTTVNTLQGT